MSKSSSMGDLVPKDITEMLALQNKISKNRKKRGSSLSRTFSWFKGSKPKRIVTNGQSQPGILGGWTGECTNIRQDDENHDVSKGKVTVENNIINILRCVLLFFSSTHLGRSIFRVLLHNFKELEVHL